MKKLFVLCIITLFALVFMPRNAFSSSGNCNMEGFLCDSGTHWAAVCGETEEEKNQARIVYLLIFCGDDYIEEDEPIVP